MSKSKTSRVQDETPARYGVGPDVRRMEEDKVIADAIAILDKRLRSRRCATGAALTDPQSAQQFLQLQFAGCSNEHFVAVFLDTRHRLIACETLFTGSVDSASVHPRVVVQRALALNAAAVIFAHNHPSGMTDPSVADHAITRRLVDACGLVDIRVLDHVILGEGTPTSMATMGLL